LAAYVAFARANDYVARRAAACAGSGEGGQPPGGTTEDRCEHVHDRLGRRCRSGPDGHVTIETVTAVTTPELYYEVGKWVLGIGAVCVLLGLLFLFFWLGESTGFERSANLLGFRVKRPLQELHTKRQDLLWKAQRIESEIEGRDPAYGEQKYKEHQEAFRRQVAEHFIEHRAEVEERAETIKLMRELDDPAAQQSAKRKRPSSYGKWTIYSGAEPTKRAL
jgi:hypothetical protein